MNTFSAEDGLSREVEKAAESKDDIASTPPASLTTATTEKNEEMAAEVDEKKPDDDNDNDKDDDDNDDDEDEEAYPSGIRLVCIVTSLCMTVFLFALDGTILATAQPAITDQFNSLDDISWYSAAFFLTTCAFQLPFGKAYALLNVKMTFIVSVLIFLVGSAVCGATPTSIGLIIGRAIAGIGGAGVLGGVFIIIAKQIPLRKRSLYAGFVGAAFSIASVLGPVIGGAFTTNVSWRWCFYINLPVGAVVLVFVFWCLPNIGKTSEEFKKASWLQKIRKFDPVGSTILLGSITALLLAITWGGETGDWGEGRTIATLVVFAVTIVIWSAMQYLQGEEATVPWSVVKQRTVAGATIYTLLGSAAFTIVIYWLPIWFQSIKGDNAEESGINSLPFTIGIVIFSIGAGGLTMVIGYYSVFLVLGSVLMAVGAGLLMTLEVDSGPGYWIGYQIIFAAGVGMSLEQCNIAVQTVLSDEMVPAGASLVIFTRSLSGSIGSAIGQNVYQDSLTSRLAGIVPESALDGSGATTLISSIQEAIGDNAELYADALDRVNDSLTRTFLVALILSCLTLPAGLVIEWKSVKKENRANEDAKEKSGRKKKKKKNNNKKESVPEGGDQV